MCAWQFGDSFDCYATNVDMASGYWDSGGTGANLTLVAGRFAGSQAINCGSSTTPPLIKSSAVNDAVHHLSMAFRQTSTLSGTTLGMYFQFTDTATNQCCIVFRSDGVILLTSATPAGTVLATYAGAVTAANTWFQFEFEVIINNTAGRFRARKNGNPLDDFDSGAVLNTRPGANAYANRLSIGLNATVTHQLDDLLWRSDASSVPWVGDIRCITRMPASDASVQFARAPAVSVTTTPAGSSASITNGQARYTQFIAAYDGTISTITVAMTTASTSNMKCSMFASSGTQPTTLLGSATAVTNPTGVQTITFPTPITVVKGTQYWIGVANDATSGAFTSTATTTGWLSFTAYASFPAANPGGSGSVAPTFSVTIGTTINAQMVNETLQDGTTSYVYDAVAGHADLYTIASIASTPTSTVAVTTRAFMQKSDAGARTAAVQMKSGATTVTSNTATLSSSSWGWTWRTDLTDPATSTAWTAAAVNNLQVGPVTVA
jgi:hypothetical protein